MHLVNNKDLLKLGLFRPSTVLTCVKAGTQALLIISTGTRRILKVIYRAKGKNTEDLVLRDVVLVKGFYLNIVSKACLDNMGY
jgi:hypothetical protein